MERPAFSRLEQQFLSTPSARRATTLHWWWPWKTWYFYPRPPRGGRPSAACCPACTVYFYPRPPRGGRPLSLQSRLCASTISIHALREEGDFVSSEVAYTRFGISIHALREEGDRCSTVYVVRETISIHALREEGDNSYTLAPYLRAEFLSTPSARRATRQLCSLSSAERDFYPRPPRGGRHLGDIFAHFLAQFLSTPSARRATAHGTQQVSCLLFLSTPSARRATALAGLRQILFHISIHALREEGDP